jgi:hypothetical protein
MEDEDIFGPASEARENPNAHSAQPDSNQGPTPATGRREEQERRQHRPIPSYAPGLEAIDDDPEELDPAERARRERIQTDAGFAAPQRWILIGPSGSGKTSLVGSFEQAVSAPARDHLELRLNARNDACQEILSSALGRLLDETKELTSTTGAEDLAFTLEVQPRYRAINVLMADAAGAAMFRGDNAHMLEQQERNIIESLSGAWRNADCLLLLIPAVRDEAVSRIPISMEISQGLSYLTRKMMRNQPVAPPPARSWLQRWFGRPAAAVPAAPRLPFKRVLILITKADVVAQKLVDEFTQWRAEQRAPNAYPTPCPLPPSLEKRSQVTAREVAEAMEPVGTARRILSEKVLNQLLKDVAHDCTVAVSFVSVKGFSRDGYPIANQRGQAIPPDNQPMSSQWRDKVVREWTPWGLRAGLYFLATGELIRGEPIAALNLEVVKERI